MTPNDNIAYLPIFFKVIFLGFVIFTVLSMDQFPTMTTRQKLNIIGVILLFYTIIEILFTMEKTPCSQSTATATAKSPTDVDILATI